MHVQDFCYSAPSKTGGYMKLYSDINRYDFQHYLKENVEHQKFFIKLRFGNNCLYLKKRVDTNAYRRRATLPSL